jgi:ubiquinone/menaquinone biosynthesis C-methylase UbiE
MAIALASYLGDDGSYEGFDVQERAIKWCKQEIELRWPQSRFHFVDVRNPQYHRGGEEASAFRFPFEDERFDFVFMTSVFTHMHRDEVENYLSETRRVLAPSGRSLITYYLLNPDVRRTIQSGDARYSFAHEVAAGCFVQRRRAPGVAVAYDEGLVEQLYRDAGLEIVPPVHHGSWSGAYRDARHGQDTIVAARR